jgi:hypothetical protein
MRITIRFTAYKVKAVKFIILSASCRRCLLLDNVQVIAMGYKQRSLALGRYIRVR